MQHTTANPRTMGYVGRVPTTLRTAGQSNEWYTPAKYIEAARLAMGSIELDPFSDKEANLVVQAKRIFTPQQNALTRIWKAKTVFMNPPYSADLVKRATQKFIEEFHSKHFTQGIVLVNNATDTLWFNQLAKHANALCFTNHRIKFYSIDSKAVSGNTRGQVFLYFRNQTEDGPSPTTGIFTRSFRDAFAPIGMVVAQI